MCVISDAAKQIEFISREELKYRKPVLKASGACWYCQEPLPTGQLFCHNAVGEDRGCAGDYENMKLADIRNGK